MEKTNKLQQFIENQLGELHSTDKESLQEIINYITVILDQKAINEDTLLVLKNAEDSIRILRDKLVNRYINLLKTTK
jgi:hypothetical protein